MTSHIRSEASPDFLARQGSVVVDLERKELGAVFQKLACGSPVYVVSQGCLYLLCVSVYLAPHYVEAYMASGTLWT